MVKSSTSAYLQQSYDCLCGFGGLSVPFNEEVIASEKSSTAKAIDIISDNDASV